MGVFLGALTLVYLYHNGAVFHSELDSVSGDMVTGKWAQSQHMHAAHPVHPKRQGRAKQISALQ